MSERDLMQVLKKAPAVIAVLTAERTKEKINDMVEDVEDATQHVLKASESAAKDVVSIFEDILEAMNTIHTTRNMRFPEDETRIIRVKEMLMGKETE